MIDHRLQPYFPTEFRWLGYIMMAASIFFFPQGNWIWPLMGLLLGVFMGWAVLGTRIDFQKHKIQEYLGVWGIKLGSWKDIPELEKITITRSLYSQVLGSRGTTSKFRTKVYRAFLRGPDNFKVPFIAHQQSEKVLYNARLVSEKLNLPILDCTIKIPQWIT